MSAEAAPRQMSWIDTPLLVYAVVNDHPARHLLEHELATGIWASTTLALLETFHVLTRDYAVTPADAGDVCLTLSSSPIIWVSPDQNQHGLIVQAMARHRLQATDATLLVLARRDAGVLHTTDGALVRIAGEQGIAAHNPIGPALASAIARWEDERLPPRGLRRILGGVHRWLGDVDPRIAQQFEQATGGLRSLPP